MKHLIISIFVLSIFSLTGCKAQTVKHSKENNYVVLTKKVLQLKPILLTVEDLKKEDAENFGDFQIIVCGKTVEDLTNKALMKDHINKAKSLGVKINACGFSLKKFGVDHKNLPKEISIVKNGILYDLQLQKKGYMSLGL